jgi:hypothetical protein
VKWLEPSDDKTGPEYLRLNPPEWALGLSYGLRTSLLAMEVFFWCFRFSIFVRRRWAASFYDAQQALGLARSIDVLHLVNVHSSIRHWVWHL